MSELARALGDPSADPEAAAAAAARIAARCGHVRLATLGVAPDRLPALAAAAATHPAVANTPDPPGEAELLAVLERAL
jgi:alcohol dehydrogenase class IV